MSDAKIIKPKLDEGLGLPEEKKSKKIESSQPAREDRKASEKPVEPTLAPATENQGPAEPTKEKTVEIAPDSLPDKNAATTDGEPKLEPPKDANVIPLRAQPDNTAAIESKAEPEKNTAPIVAEIKAENIERTAEPATEAKVEEEEISTTVTSELKVVPEKNVADVPIEQKSEPEKDKPEIPIVTKLEAEKMSTETKVEAEKNPTEAKAEAEKIPTEAKAEAEKIPIGTKVEAEKIPIETKGEAEKIPGEIPVDTKPGPEPIVSMNGENAQQPQLPEMKQLETIGAGDPGLTMKSMENDICKLERKKPDEKKEESIAATTVVEEKPAESKESISPPICDNAPKIDQTPTIDDVKADKDTCGDTCKFTADKLKQERTDDGDSYKRKLEIAEKKLADLQASYDSLIKGGGDEVTLRRMVEQLKSKLYETTQQLHARMRDVAHQEKQINALNHQVASLKEVESLTRSLLQIRNMEVKQLQTEVDNMEVKINEERARYNTMINKMDSAVQLNADLKKEYETQLCLFRDLREKYEEKVTLLTAEKKALETSQAAPQ